MKTKTKRCLIGFAVALVLGCLLLNVGAYRHASAMMHFAPGGSRTRQPEKLAGLQKAKALFCGVNLPRPRSERSPFDLGANARVLRLECTNGVTLGAWYCAAPAGDWLVILFHGYAAEKSSTLPQAKAFLDMGTSVLLVDFRGSGDSSESYTTVGHAEAEDAAAALRYARAQLPHRRVALYGQSMGAAAILGAVHGWGARPDAIIVESVFDRLLHTVRHRFEAMGLPSFPGAHLLVFWGGCQAGFNAFRHNPSDYASSVRCPILFLHGASDPRARLEEARLVFDAVRAPKSFTEFPRLGHEALLIAAPDQWKKAVGGFLREAEKPSLRIVPLGLNVRYPLVSPCEPAVKPPATLGPSRQGPPRHRELSGETFVLIHSPPSLAGHPNSMPALGSSSLSSWYQLH